MAEAAVAAMPRPVRRKLPDERQSITHKFDIAGHEGYITVGMFEDGQPGEIFLVMAKEGSTISGFADAFAQAISYALAVRRAAAGAGRQVQPRPLRAVGHDHEPRGALRQVDRRLHLPVDVDEVHVEGSAVQRRREHGRTRAARINVAEPVVAKDGARAEAPKAGFVGAAIQNQEDAPPCSTCGSIMIRSGSCYKCANCGTTSGCA